MRAKTVERLTRWALAGAAGDVDGIRQRWARRRLAGATERGQLAAAEALFHVWLTGPAPDVWDLVLRGLNRHTLSPVKTRARLAAEAAAAAVDPDRSNGNRAALGSFLMARGLAPEEPVDRVLFLVMTGQVDQQQALDPDGSVLAAVYRAAGGATRAVLRETLVDAGGLDAVQVVAGRDRVSAEDVLDPEEAAYLARQLADRKDWPQLWRLALGAPLPRAVELVGLVDGWEPPTARDREVFRQLAAFPVDAWVGAEEALWAAAQIRVPLPGPDDGYRPVHDVRSGRFVDGRHDRVVVAGRFLTTEGKGRELVLTYDLVEGVLVDEVRLEGSVATAVLRAGPERTLVAEQGLGAAGNRYGNGPAPELRAYGSGSGALLVGSGVNGSAMYPFGDRILEVDPAGAIGLWASEPRPTDGSTGEAWPGTPRHRASFEDLGLRQAGRRALLAADELLGRVVLGDWAAGRLKVVDRDLTQVATNRREEPATFVDSAVFDGPDRLVTMSGKDDVLTVWHVDGAVLVRSDQVPLRDVGWPSFTQQNQRPLALPLARTMVALRASRSLVHVDLDRFDLVEQRARRGYAREQATSLWRSADGELLGAATQDELVVDDTRLRRAVDLLDRPLASLDLRDLAMIVAADDALPDHTGGPARELLGLFRACLEVRLGAEVALGGGSPASSGAAGPHDVAISWS